MTVDDLRTILLRDLATVKRELLAYPDPADIWAKPDGIPNSAGTLALHLAGNLHHYVGAVLGGTHYVRDREGEFGDRDLPLEELLGRLDSTARVVDAVLGEMDGARLDETFPADFPMGRVRTGRFLLHLAIHFGYHLGQIDYHRRMVTGQGQGVEAQSLKAIF
ncbi:MAG: DinB family protein [Gemmatimonadales bacterium]|nr:MAG: DinB family protein [Gemmatimonadales bacterium]